MNHKRTRGHNESDTMNHKRTRGRSELLMKLMSRVTDHKKVNAIFSKLDNQTLTNTY
jgi:hypothetical protein